MLINWKKDARFQYSNSYNKIIVSNSDTLTNELTQFNTEIYVADESDSGYKVHWKLHKITTDSKKFSWVQLMNLCMGMNFELNVSKDSGLIEITNVRSLQKELENRFIKNLVELGELDRVDGEEFRTLIQNVVTSEEAFKTIIAGHISVYFKFHGFKFSPKKSIETVIQTKTAMSDNSIDTWSRVYLGEIDSLNESFEIHSEEKLNSTQLSSIYKSYYLQKYSLSELPESVESDLANILSNKVANFTFNNNGTVMEGNYSDILKMPKTTRIELFLIELK